MGTPKSSILIGFSIINHPFWSIPIFGNTHITSILPLQKGGLPSSRPNLLFGSLIRGIKLSCLVLFSDPRYQLEESWGTAPDAIKVFPLHQRIQGVFFGG